MLAHSLSMNRTYPQQLLHPTKFAATAPVGELDPWLCFPPSSLPLARFQLEKSQEPYRSENLKALVLSKLQEVSVPGDDMLGVSSQGTCQAPTVCRLMLNDAKFFRRDKPDCLSSSQLSKTLNVLSR